MSKPEPEPEEVDRILAFQNRAGVTGDRIAEVLMKNGYPPSAEVTLALFMLAMRVWAHGSPPIPIETIRHVVDSYYPIVLRVAAEDRGEAS